MMNAIVRFFRFIKMHFGKIVFGLLVVILFIFLLFPFSDLNDLVSIQVSKATQNKVYLQFEDIHINPITLSLSFDKVSVDTPQLSTLSMKELTIYPSLTAIAQQKAGGSANAQGFLNGEVKVSISPNLAASAKSDKDKPVDKYNFEVSGQNLSLKEIKDLLGLSLPLKGQLQFSTQGLADINLLEQPEGEFSLTVTKFELPPSTLSTLDLGRINLPEINLNQIDLKGKLANGKFVIDSGKIGTPKDEFYGDIKGELALTFQNLNGQVVPLLGAYDISLDLKATSLFKERAKFFLSFLDGYKKDFAGGSEYKFKVKTSSMGAPPQITPLQ